MIRHIICLNLWDETIWGFYIDIKLVQCFLSKTFFPACVHLTTVTLNEVYRHLENHISCTNGDCMFTDEGIQIHTYIIFVPGLISACGQRFSAKSQLCCEPIITQISVWSRDERYSSAANIRGFCYVNGLWADLWQTTWCSDAVVKSWGQSLLDYGI